jgi:diaminopimelate epimerase
MRIPFIKMHGLGNDFVVLDARDGTLPPLEAQVARAIADRRTGIGCDQVIVLEPSAIADFRMRIRNADGGEVEACGNATRAVAMLHGEPVEIETVAGVLSARPEDAEATLQRLLLKAAEIARPDEEEPSPLPAREVRKAG